MYVFRILNIELKLNPTLSHLTLLDSSDKLIHPCAFRAPPNYTNSEPLLLSPLHLYSEPFWYTTPFQRVPETRFITSVWNTLDATEGRRSTRAEANSRKPPNFRFSDLNFWRIQVAWATHNMPMSPSEIDRQYIPTDPLYLPCYRPERPFCLGEDISRKGAGTRYIGITAWDPTLAYISLCQDTTLSHYSQLFPPDDVIDPETRNVLKRCTRVGRAASASPWDQSKVHPTRPSLPPMLSTRTTLSFGRRHFEDRCRDTIHRNHGTRTDTRLSFITSRQHIIALLTTIPTGRCHWSGDT